MRKKTANITCLIPIIDQSHRSGEMVSWQHFQIQGTLAVSENPNSKIMKSKKIKSIFMAFAIAFLLLLNDTVVLSQYGWMIRGAGVASDALVKGISFADVNNGMLVTTNFSGYKVYRTSDGGMNWTGQTIPTSNGMWAVKYFNPSTAIVCGASGSVYRTTNGGSNWNQINPGGSYFLCAFSFLDNNTGWMSGGPLQILKTTNGGVNWTSQSSFSTYTYSAIHMFDINIGFAVDYFQRIVKTTNSGVNWLDVSGPSGFDELWGVFMTDDSVVYSCGENSKIIKTTNAGASWTVYNAGLQRNLYAIHFVNSNTGYCVGDSSLILRTSNAGNSWEVQSFPPTEATSSSSLTCISFVNSNTGYVGGNDGTVYFTTTGGLSPMQNISSEIPDRFELKQNYPNPFNPATTIEFDIPKESDIRLEVFDINGKVLEILKEGRVSPGSYRYEWNAGNFSSGVYFYRLTAGKLVENRKMVLIK